jgi:hypothetical protein
MADVKGNIITDANPSPFRHKRRLSHLDMSGNKINSINQTHLYITQNWNGLVWRETV